MALEDLTGPNKFIANLVVTNPLASDDRREGDDHIRGIKNVLLNTFGALDKAVSYVDVEGDTMSGPLVVPELNVSKAASGQSTLIRGQLNAATRWTINLGDNAAESGGNAGSNFGIGRYNDAGAFIDQPLQLNRQSGQVQLTQALSIGLGVANSTGQLVLNSQASEGKDLQGRSAGSLRWVVRLGSGTSDGTDDFVVYRHNDAGVQQSGQFRILRSNGSIIMGSTVQTGTMAGGGSSAEMQIYPAASAAGGSPGAWPTTGGGLVGVRGSAHGSYSAGAVSCYSGSGNTGVNLLNAANAWSAQSDERLKNIDSEVSDGLQAVLAMRPIRYRYKFEDADARLRVGLSAQSVQQYVPEAIDEAPVMQANGKMGTQLYLQLRMQEVIPALVSAIQTLSARVDELEAARR